jgi:transposase
MLMKQRTMLINALRGLMAEFGIVVSAGTRHVGELTAILVDPEEHRIPALLKDGLQRMVEMLCASSDSSRALTSRSWTGGAATRPTGI